MEFIAYWDQQALVVLNGWGGPVWDSFWLFATETFTWSWLYVLVLAGIFWEFRWAGLLTIAFIAFTVALCDQISVHAFKEVFQRLRPCHDPAVQSFIREVGNRCGGEFGFVSSHAANSIGLAVFLSRTLRGVAAPVSWLIPAMAIWAFLTSYSRVYIGVHYPTDVLAGAALGALIGGFMGYFHGVMRPLLPKFSR